MNLNYIGSVAERFMKFRSSLATTEDVSENLFNAVSIYVPKSKAAANIKEAALDPSTVMADAYAVVAVDVDNYNDILLSTGNLYSQWLKVFNDGVNTSVVLYLIVFDDTTFTPVVSDKSIAWSPLTKAFNDLYFISFFKTLFDEDYTGKDAEGEVTNFTDLALCLSVLCAGESTLSWYMCEVHGAVPTGADENKVKILSHTRGEETTHCTTLTGSSAADRAEYFWGYVNLIGGTHTSIMFHNGSVMIPIVLGKWFEQTNASGEFVGNKLAKIRLSGSAVKPTGNPSPLNSDVNLNLPKAYYTNLDDKFVGYFISISGSSLNNAELLRERSVENFPCTAYMMSKWIDYSASQDIANFAAESETLTKPRLCNQDTYTAIQMLLQTRLQAFIGTNRLTNISMKFPPFAEAKKGNGFEGTAVWSATYIDDFDHVDFSGTISF